MHVFRIRTIHTHSSGNKHFKINMCSGPILPKMLLFAVPLMFSSILQLLFNAADIIVVGRYAGDNSLAAVGSNTALIGLLTNLFIGVSIGTNVLAARYYGAKEENALSETVHTSMFLAVASGIFLTLVGVVFARKILIIMQTPAEVLGLATLYLVIYFFGMTPMMIYNFGSAVLRAVGDTRRPLFYLAVAGVINVVLNLFFVINLHLDVAGVAIATVISQCVSAALVVRCLMRESGGIRFVPSETRIHADKLVKILKIGVPAGIQGVLFSLSNVVIQSSINTFGAVTMAGNSAAQNIEQFVYFAMNSFYVTLGMACVVFGHSLLRIYSPSEAVIAAGISRFHIVAATYFLCGLMDGMVGALRGLGYSARPRLLRAADDSHADRLVRAEARVDFPALPDSRLPHGHGRLSLLSRVVDRNLRSARRGFPLGYKEGRARGGGEAVRRRGARAEARRRAVRIPELPQNTKNPRCLEARGFFYGFADARSSRRRV